MTFSPNIYSTILIVSGIITLLLCINIFRRYEIVVRWFGFMVLAIAVWALSYGFELATTKLEEMLFWINLEYLGVSFMPACWFFFIVKFTGRDEWISKRNLALVLVIPIVTLLLVWTNDYHHLHYKNISIDSSGPFPLLTIERGPWYFVHTFYFYVMLLWGIALLVDKYRKADKVFKKQNLIILIAAFIPWIANLLYFFGVRPEGHIDITPFAFIGTVLLLSMGLVRFRLLDIIPIARERVLESMQEGLLVADNKDRIVDLNREIKSLLSIGEPNLIGKELSYILPQQPDLYEMIKTRAGGLMQIEIIKNDVPLYLEMTLSPMYEEKDVYSGIIILCRDITHRVNMDKQVRIQAKQLLALNKLKDKLFSIISHDLRSPLHNLLDLLKMIDDHLITPQEFSILLPQLSRNVGYTSGLLENLLFWSRSQLQGEVIKPVEIRVRQICENIIDLFERVVTEKQIVLVNKIEPDSTIYADQDMIQLVIRNLISNAVKFSNRGGTINLSSFSDGHITRVCVEDDGVGISDDHLPKIFEIETFTTRGTDNEQGTGLGLLLSKDFIEKNHGRIWIESKLNEGSKFFVELPLTEEDIVVQEQIQAEL
ncbi:histidine kinase N-terminal 7TM domain-containing protein [Daejeonella sp.]|uniref:sensor histidine kinase n=1 Tax=Daejeonella sp. TaxID=2805397 RepID=UPI003983AA5A